MAKLKSGQNAPKTGQYAEKDSRGKKVNTVQVSKGDRMPPTRAKKHYFEEE